ncbi:MAG: hypothetical protein ACRDSL_13575 [Pseudonocardiaceae bacterium]
MTQPIRRRPALPPGLGGTYREVSGRLRKVTAAVHHRDGYEGARGAAKARPA